MHIKTLNTAHISAQYFLYIYKKIPIRFENLFFLIRISFSIRISTVGCNILQESFLVIYIMS